MGTHSVQHFPYGCAGTSGRVWAVSDGGVRVDRLRTAQANALRKAMVDARLALDQAHADYQHAFAAAVDLDANVDGAYGLVQQGRAYAAALTRYTEAIMGWLIFADAKLGAKKADNAR